MEARSPGRGFRPCKSLPGAAIFLFLLLGAVTAMGVSETRIWIEPAGLELDGRNSEHGLLVTAKTPGGQIFDVTSRCIFTSSDPSVVGVSSNGLCRAGSRGRAEITATFLGRRARTVVTATAAPQAGSPSFRQDVVPILTRYGCNAGGCHGKLAGQNNFRLSLRGYAPELDHEWLTTEFNGRRINYAVPGDSLVLLKPTGKTPHEGRFRFDEQSRAYQVLRRWIESRAPGPDARESDASRLEILPGDRKLRVGDSQQLLVRAVYADGSRRDVTWLCQFFSNDEAMAEVSPEGVVKCLRPGETSVRVHFQGQVGVVTVSSPYPNAVSPGMYTASGKNPIDGFVLAKLADLRIPPSGLCDDATFLRRASLDTIGTLPSAEETRRFLADGRPDKRARLIDDLLARPEFLDFWALQLSDLLQNRKERDHDVRGTKGVRSFQAWLRGELASNRPWNELAREVLLASGDCVEHPELGYFITLIGEKKAEESEVVDSVAQAFLGTRVGCARCHNHPLEKFTQDDYFHFAAFFSKVSLKRQEPGKGLTELFSVSKDEQDQSERITRMEKDLAGAEKAAGGAEEKLSASRKKLAEARQRLTQLQKEKKPGVIQPRTRQFMAPQPLDRAAVELAPGEDPRRVLAEWITSPTNRNFSGAMINRLWKHFLGVGLVEQVDDLRASNPPSNGPLWNWLNNEFTSHGYDLRHLMRVILNSQTYQASSSTRPGNETDKKFHSHYYARRLPAEVLSDAISAATGVPDSFAGYPLGTRAITLPEPGVSSYFLSLFGRSERVTACACERNGEVTLPQLLHLNNGDEVLKKLRAGDGRLKMLSPATSTDEAIEEIFLSTLGRAARPDEMLAVARSLLGTGVTRGEVLEDLFWALLNTKEFAFNH